MKYETVADIIAERDALKARLAEASKLLDRWHTAYHEKDRDSLLECCDDDTSTFLYSTKRTDSSCDHVWVNASNFEPGPNEICLKCTALRAADSAPAVTGNCGLCGEPRADHAEVAPDGKPECRMKCKRCGDTGWLQGDPIRGISDEPCGCDENWEE